MKNNAKCCEVTEKLTTVNMSSVLPRCRAVLHIPHVVTHLILWPCEEGVLYIHGLQKTKLTHKGADLLKLTQVANLTAETTSEPPTRSQTQMGKDRDQAAETQKSRALG